MNYFWTIQKKEVLDIINKDGIYYPDKQKSKATSSKNYNKILYTFNTINKTNYDGLIFGFAKKLTAASFKNIDELYDYFIKNPNVTFAFPFWSDKYVIMQLKIDEDYNLIPIDFNDFNQLDYPIFGIKALDNIMVALSNGIYNEKCKLPSFAQVHFPYINKDSIIKVYGNFNKKLSDSTNKLHTFPI